MNCNGFSGAGRNQDSYPVAVLCCAAELWQEWTGLDWAGLTGMSDGDGNRDGRLLPVCMDGCMYGCLYILIYLGSWWFQRGTVQPRQGWAGSKGLLYHLLYSTIL